MRPGAFIPVWREHRYLPLVLEQAELCPGPVIVLHQDKPWFWTQPGEPPSGWESPVVGAFNSWRRVSEPGAPRIIEQVERSPSEADTVNYCVSRLKDLGAEVCIRLDSDWLFTLDDMWKIYDTLREARELRTWGCVTWHYWRDFCHAMGVPTMGLTTDGWPPKPCDAMLGVTMYHPAYIHTNEEMREKVSSWGHALDFEKRGFYEKEWVAKNDLAVAPYECPFPPEEIIERLGKAGAL